MEPGFQTFLIIFSAVVGIILLAINSYILFLYLHSDDKGIKRAPYGKIIVVLGLTLCQAQALLVPLDVAFKSNYPNLYTNDINMKTLWSTLYLSLIAIICFFIPLAIFYYESDPEHSFFRRLLRSFGYLFLTLVISVGIFMITWNFLCVVELPYTMLQ